MHRESVLLQQLCLTSCAVLQGWATKSGDDHSRLVNVNNRLVSEGTVLEDGDYLVFSRELLTI